MAVSLFDKSLKKVKFRSLWVTVNTVLHISTLLTGVGSTSCTYDKRITAASRNIKSPLYPAQFPPQTQCMWRLHTERGFRIKVSFSSFRLAPKDTSGDCRVQWINIIGGDKIADDPSLMRTFCGSDLPRTIISSGNVLRINLHSNNDARSHAYLGFMANVVQTLEAAYMPGDLPVNAPTGVQRPSLGGVLPQNPRPSNPGPTTESERIEEMNRRRNLGLPPLPERPRNPVRRPNRILAGSPPRYNRRQTSIETPTRVPYVPRKRGPRMSKEIQIVVIMVGVLSGLFILVLVLKKCGLFRWICNRATGDEKNNSNQGMEKKNSNLNPSSSGINTLDPKEMTKIAETKKGKPETKVPIKTVSSRLESSKSMMRSDNKVPYTTTYNPKTYNNRSRNNQYIPNPRKAHNQDLPPPLPPRSTTNSYQPSRHRHRNHRNERTVSRSAENFDSYKRRR